MRIVRSLTAAASVGLWLMPLSVPAIAQSDLNVSDNAGQAAALPPRNEVTIGGGWLSNSSAFFGRYNGHPDRGWFGLGGFHLEGGDAWDSGGTNYWSADGRDLGFDTRSFDLDTYTRLLEDTIARLKGEKQDLWPAPEVSMEGAAFLPDAYVPEGSQKLHLYRRISRMESIQQVTALRAELRDRFGPLPPEVGRLLDAAALRLLGARLGVERILVREHEARVNFRADVTPRLAALQGAFRDQQLEVEVRRTTPLSLVLRRYGSEPLTGTLAAAFELLDIAGKAQAA